MRDFLFGNASGILIGGLIAFVLLVVMFRSGPKK